MPIRWWRPPVKSCSQIKVRSAGQLADRQHPFAQAREHQRRPRDRADRLSRGRRRGSIERQAPSLSVAASRGIRCQAPRCIRSPIADLKQVYAADDRANIEIGNVYPTSDIRGALYVDAMLGKHFALLGSTRHRQIDRRSADPAPHLRYDAAGPYRDGRSARRIFRRVQGQWRAVRRIETSRCRIG